jgi:hypothetical protein
MNQAILNNHGDLGFEFEKYFQDLCLNNSIDCKRFDVDNLSNPDFILDDRLLVDTKVKVEVFRKSLSMVGIEPLKCVCIDLPKIKSYEKAANEYNLPMLILMKVCFDFNDELKINTYIITLNKLISTMNLNKQRIQCYPDHQKDKDEKRFYFSTNDMIEISSNMFVKKYKEGKII